MRRLIGQMCVAIVLITACGGHTVPSPSKLTSPPAMSASPSSSAAASTLPETARPAISPTTLSPSKLVGDAAYSYDLGQLFRISTLANWGPKVWYARQEDGAIYGADVRVGEQDVIARATAGFPDDLKADAAHLFWADWIPHSEDKSSWQIERLDQESGDVAIVASGDSKWTGLMSEIGPKLGLGDDRLAYAIGAPTPSNPLAARIVVQGATDGQPIRTIDTDGVVWDLAVADGVVAYTVGEVDPQVMDDTFNLRLYLSRDSDREPALVAEHAFEVNVDGDWLIWNSRPDSPDFPTGRFGAVEATDLRTLETHVISSPGTEDGSLGAWIATAADGIAAWSEVSGDAATLLAWNESTGITTEVARAQIQFQTAVGGGWLVWQVHTELAPGHKTEAMFGMPTAELAR